MAIHPNPNFPILQSDQTEVIQIFLDLMSKSEHAESSLRFADDLPISMGFDANGAWIPDELRDSE